MTGYPRGFYLFLLSVVTLLVVSGLMLIPSLVDVQLGWDVPVRVNGPLRLESAALHSLAGFLTLGAIGSLTTLHVRRGWHRRQNHLSGTALLGLFVTLLITALGIYYLGDPDWSRLASVSHAALGLTAIATMLWHHANGRRIRARDRMSNRPFRLRGFPGSPCPPRWAEWPEANRKENSNP